MKNRPPKGPEPESKFYDPYRDGVTQGLLARFIRCRQEAQWFIRGLDRLEQSESLAQMFGNVFHALLQHLYEKPNQLTTKRAQVILKWIEDKWEQEHPRASAALISRFQLALSFAEAVIPIYLSKWKSDAKKKWIGLESAFNIPYVVRQVSDDDGAIHDITIPVRGVRDGVFEEKKNELWLFETKTKSLVDEGFLLDWLEWDLQTQLYTWSLHREHERRPTGVLYNVIRKPLLRQSVKETAEEFVKRCAADVRDRPDHYFYRFEMRLEESDLVRFEGELEDLIREFERWYLGQAAHYRNSNACQIYGLCWAFEACAKRLDPYKKRLTVFREISEEL